MRIWVWRMIERLWSAVFCAVLLACVGQTAQARVISLEEVFGRCNDYAVGRGDIFAGLADIEVDPTDAAITYQRIETDAGLVTVKLIAGTECWLYGTAFNPGHRSTTIKWDDIRPRAEAWLNQTDRGPVIGRTENAAGMNVLVCAKGGKAHQNTATGGGTDDKDRALTFSSRVFDYRKCP